MTRIFIATKFLPSLLFLKRKSSKIYKIRMYSVPTIDEQMISAMHQIIPPLTSNKYKGQCGRIGIFGGSLEYTGAPYYAGMSALRVGADLVHIFCTKEASLPIKCLSPELIVHPLLEENNSIEEIRPWLDRLHVIVIGCGLGRSEKVLMKIAELIKICRSLKKPLVIDADGLFFIGQNPSLVKDYPGLILTPNAMEFTRLFKAFLDESIQVSSVAQISNVKHLANCIGKDVVILHKGETDIIASGNDKLRTLSCSLSGSSRRCGGQGDLLAGSLAVFWYWSMNSEVNINDFSPQIIACYAASRLTRECNFATYKLKSRAMLTTDMIGMIGSVFLDLFQRFD